MESMHYLSDSDDAMRFCFDVSRYTEFDYVRDKLIYRLVNHERNRERLKNIPHRRFLDLAVIYCCAFKTVNNDNAGITVTYEHINLWGISEEELFEIASRNTRANYAGRIEPLPDVLNRISGMNMLPDDMGTQLYICSNEDYFYGASAILYDGLLKDFSEKLNDSLIILPSSVHEVILLPDRDADNYADLEKLVDYVNKTEVAPNEILSDKIYKYDRMGESIDMIFVTIL